MVAGLVAVVVVVAGFGAYYLSLSSNARGLQSSGQHDCAYSPGNGFYLQVLSDAGGTPLSGLAVTGELVSGCPVVGTCAGSGGGVPSCAPPPMTDSTLGKWSFVTNATGYVSVPSSELGGSAFWLNVMYSGKSYLAKSPVCGDGITLAQLSLPSGALSGHEVPSNSGGVVAGQGPNGVQTVSGCNPVTFQGDATIS
jgi:hypothetical protein